MRAMRWTGCSKTNCFPNSPAASCPALCEAACTCGLNGDSVTVRDNELSIIEEAFAKGWMTPHAPEVRTDKRVAIVGSGPSGLAAAQMLNQRGHHVTVYERADRPGGLLMYGIPNMKLDKSVVARRVEKMRQEGVEFITNVDVGAGIPAESLVGQYDAVLLCCGAGQPRDLNVPGRDAEGVMFAVDFLTSATKRLIDGAEAVSAAGKDVVIVGGGDTGNDCVGTSIRMGCKSVTPARDDADAAGRAHGQLIRGPEWPRVLKIDYGQEEAIDVFGGDPRRFETTVKEILKDDQGRVCAPQNRQLKGRDEVPGQRAGDSLSADVDRRGLRRLPAVHPRGI